MNMKRVTMIRMYQGVRLDKAIHTTLSSKSVKSGSNVKKVDMELVDKVGVLLTGTLEQVLVPFANISSLHFDLPEAGEATLHGSIKVIADQNCPIDECYLLKEGDDDESIVEGTIVHGLVGKKQTVTKTTTKMPGKSKNK